MAPTLLITSRWSSSYTMSSGSGSGAASSGGGGRTLQQMTSPGLTPYDALACNAGISVMQHGAQAACMLMSCCKELGDGRSCRQRQRRARPPACRWLIGMLATRQGALSAGGVGAARGPRTCCLPFTTTRPSLMEACSRARLAVGSLAARYASSRSLLCSPKPAA